MDLLSFGDVIEGDFSLSAISMRLLAPDPDALMRYMPDATPDQSLEKWPAFAASVDWTQEAQSLLYMANLVHELQHLIQHTTLFQCMYQVSRLHRLTIHTDGVFGRLRKFSESHPEEGAGMWPPRIPLLDWFKAVAGSVADPLVCEWIDFCLQYRLYLGDEGAATDYNRFLHEQGLATLPSPYNPRVSDLAVSELPQVRQWSGVPLTTTALLESQATMFAYRFIGSFYGQALADELVLSVSTGAPDPTYHLLPFIVLNDIPPMVYMFPMLVDWAFGGSGDLPRDDRDTVTRIKDIQPTWRFCRLYNAARSILLSDGKVGRGQPWTSDEEFAALRERTLRVAGLHDDRPEFLVEWVKDLPDMPLRQVFLTNCTHRQENERAYAMLEANLGFVQNSLCIPLLQFREQPLVRYQVGLGRNLSPVDQLRLDFYARKLFNLNRMIEGARPQCPFCQGLEYRTASGATVKRHPPIGSGMITVASDGKEHDLFVSPHCRCFWAHEFRDTWGVLPEQLLFHNGKESG